MTKVAQKLTTFWALVENIAFVPKTAVTSFGLPWEKLGYSLLQHLVTLHATAKSGHTACNSEIAKLARESIF